MSGVNRQKNRTGKWACSARRGFVRTIAGIVVLCTVFALAVPVFAQETAGADSVMDLTGKVLHTHNKFCRNSEGKLICPLPELEEHEHSDDCYRIVPQGHIHTDDCYVSERGALICDTQEQAGHIHTDACYKTVSEGTTAAHAHTAACYTKTKGEQICTIPEQAGHAHTEGCYVSTGTLICALEENEEHTHGASCYEKVLNCGTPEEAGHTHSDACFAWTEVLTCDAKETTGAAEKVLICTIPEQAVHTHDDTCYEWTKVLSCGEEENAQVTEPAESEKVLICSKPELKKHTHGKTCYAAGRKGVGMLICKLPQLEAHKHTQDCLAFDDADLICQTTEGEEHSHDYRCYRSWSFLCKNGKLDRKPQSDPNADVETPEIWEKTFEHVKLTGAWPQDLLTIAQTQLGYTESERNFIIENGVTKGYTRYGEWYGGVEYGSWCAMFIAFCMYYADIEGIPFSCGCDQWVNLLKESGMYADADTHTPRPGDIVFFDSGRALMTPDTVPIVADHVGIVAQVIPATETEPAAIVTIEGNYYDAVRNETRYLDDPKVIGYGVLPDGPAAYYSCGLKKHAHGTGCYDETGKLVCRIAEHTHDENCRSRKLRYADENISLEVTLLDAVYLPVDLQLHASLVTEQEMPTYSAMSAAIEQAMPDVQFVPEDALFCQMWLTADGKPYELPDGIKANVQVTFNRHMSAAAQNAADKYTFVLIEESPEVFAKTTYRAVKLIECNYQCADDGTVGVRFETDCISAFSVVINTHQQVALKNTLLLDLISKIMQ